MAITKQLNNTQTTLFVPPEPKVVKPFLLPTHIKWGSSLICKWH